MDEQKQVEEMAEIIRNHCANCQWENDETHECGTKCKMEAIYNADYRKVKQGEWVDVKKSHSTSLGGKGTSPYRMCTACKWEYPIVTVGQHLKKYNYCPNCGAKMKGE